MLGFFFIRCTNGLLHVQNHAIGIGSPYLDVAGSIDNFYVRIQRNHGLPMFVEAEIIAGDVPQIDFIDIEHIPKIGTDVYCRSQRASPKNNEQEYSYF